MGRKFTRGADDGHIIEINVHLISFLRIDLTKGFNVFVKTLAAEEGPKGKQINSESQVPLKFQTLLMIQMYRDRKVGVFKINCSKELRTRQKIQWSI